MKGMPPRQRVALIGLGSDKDHKLIESVLHSDSRKNTTPEKLDSAFIAYHQRIKPTLEGLRKQIELAEKAEARKYKEARQHDETSERRRLEEWVSRPRTPEEWDERKRQVSEERAAKRAAKKA